MAEFAETRAIQCKLEIHRTIYYCGIYSHISIVKHGEHEYIYDTSKEAGERLYETGFIRFKNHIIGGIKVNSTTTHPMVYAGYVNSDGKCNGSAYSDPYGDWEWVVVLGTLKITLQEQKAKVDLNMNYSILRAWAHNEGYCVTSDNARRRSEPRRSRGVGETKPRQSRNEAEARSVLRALSRVS